MTKDTLTIDEMATFCKRKGIAYPSSEIYGGMAGFYDYGPVGCELRSNLKTAWWNSFVRARQDMVGIDGTIVTHPKVWHASGHLANFSDPLLLCSKCSFKTRADTFIEEKLKQTADGLSCAQITKLVADNNLVCPQCKGSFKDALKMNLMLETHIGPLATAENVAYLRPETAQVIFTQFKNITETTRVKLPFGVAQVGKAYRNEISPRNFLFRLREFEQMEIEYFIHPNQRKTCPYIEEVLSYELALFDKNAQETKGEAKVQTIEHALKTGVIKNQWHAYFVALCHKWFTSLGVKSENLRMRQHLDSERAHYSTDCWDVEYKFPFGFKELWGIADRGTYDLDAHMKVSGKDLSIFDEESKSRVVPHVIEPSLGVDRAFLVFLFDAYTYDATRDNVVLKLHPRLAPVTVGIFPLMKKDGLSQIAQELYDELKEDFATCFDVSGTVGKRYARMDEQGTPYCITIDYQTKDDKTVTIRDRDTAKQIRIPIADVSATLTALMKGKKLF
jgi:glycyl-tRNA synthetase